MKTRIVFSLAALLLLALFGCPSGPTTTAEKPESEYNTAKKLKNKITVFGFDAFAPDEFNAGNAKFKEGEDAYEKDNAVSKAAFDEAIVNYKNVLHAGIEAKTREKQDEIDPVARKAEEIKANVATPDEYTKAKEAYDRAMELAKEDNWDEAEPMFNDAKTLYEDAYTKSKGKKDRATDAMETSKQKLDEAAALGGELEQQQTDAGEEPAPMMNETEPAPPTDESDMEPAPDEGEPEDDTVDDGSME
jgi:tetratricopeptide (TPR) repeat protein